MIRKCAWAKCGKEFDARGKKKYCSDKCKKNYENSLRGKAKAKKADHTQVVDDEDLKDQRPLHVLIVQLTKISTTVDQCVRFQVDIDVKKVDFDTLPFLNQSLILGFPGDGPEGDKEPEKKGAERFF